MSAVLLNIPRSQDMHTWRGQNVDYEAPLRRNLLSYKCVNDISNGSSFMVLLSCDLEECKEGVQVKGHSSQ